MKRLLLFAAAALFSMPLSAPAWDEGGHLLIGELAARQLQPGVLRKVEALAARLDPQFNGGQPYNAVTAGVWLDDQRALGKQNPWSRLHYIDVPCNGDRFDAPPPPHALSGMEQAAATLRDPHASESDRAVALALLIHLTGDLHQPLHTADRHDRGGNDIKLEPLFPGKNPPGPQKLHAFWDIAYRLDAPGGTAAELWRVPARSEWPQGPRASNKAGWIAARADACLQSVSTNPVAAVLRQPCPWEAWARETHAIACRAGWPAGSSPAAPASLSPEFIHQAHQTALAQVVHAGQRLAALLNHLLDDPHPPAAAAPAAASAPPAAGGPSAAGSPPAPAAPVPPGRPIP